MQKGLKTKGKAGRKKLAEGKKRQKLTLTLDPMVIAEAKAEGVQLSRAAETGLIKATNQSIRMRKAFKAALSEVETKIKEGSPEYHEALEAVFARTLDAAGGA